MLKVGIACTIFLPCFLVFLHAFYNSVIFDFTKAYYIKIAKRKLIWPAKEKDIAGIYIFRK